MPYVPTPNTVDYVELVASDLQASRKFFEQLFGWTFTDYGPDYTSFDDGRLNGGFRRLAEGEVPGNGGVLVVFYTEDIDAIQRKVESLGGTITQPVFEFPGGRRFHFLGPDNIEYAIWSL